MLHIDFVGIRELDAALAKFSNTLKNPETLFRGLGQSVVPGVFGEHFDTRFFGNLPITELPNVDLIDTGLFQDASTTPGHPGNIFETSRDELLFGVRTSYFAAVSGRAYPPILEAKYSPYEMVANSPLLQRRVESYVERWANDLVDDLF